jgi:hypothetical protein
MGVGFSADTIAWRAKPGEAMNAGSNFMVTAKAPQSKPLELSIQKLLLRVPERWSSNLSWCTPRVRLRLIKLLAIVVPNGKTPDCEQTRASDSGGSLGKLTRLHD